METFLEKTANHILERYEDIIPEICIVLPNRRASLFLRKHISRKLKKVSWSPQIYSIEDLIFKLSGLNIIDNTSFLFELYEIHKVIEKEKAQDFDEFTKWAQVLLHDFNEIDQHLASAKSLFNYLSDIKSLTNWNPGQEEPTEFQKQYVSFFQSLYIYYEKINKNLDEQNSAYHGKAYRFVAENILNLIKNVEWSKIIFAGFNALTTSEEKIIFELELAGKADILWDTDAHYLQQLESGIFHEAGFFIRKYLKKYKKENFKWLIESFNTEKKNIQIYGVAKQIGQAKLCGQILDENPDILVSKHNSAIVLADENLLFPILNSLPEIKDLNATMGIPLNATPVYDFIKSILDLHQKSFVYQKMQNKSVHSFHYSDILKILNHSILLDVCENISGITQAEYRKLTNKILKSNQVFHSNKSIQAILNHPKINPAFFDLLFSDWSNDLNQAFKNSREILEHLRDVIIKKQLEKNLDLKIELEYIYQFSLLFTKISNYQTKYGALKNIKSLYSFFNQLSKTEKLSLYGEPLQGLQLMGMLETRTLDFENLILCSVNENILPGSGKQNSFIPFDIRHEFKLPTYREKNAVFAYHFFRLLQRAKNIHLIYNTEADPIAGGDKSRFLYQLQEEFSNYSNININEKIVSSALSNNSSKEIIIDKTEEIIELLKEKALKGFSPSSLNTYKRCSLQFYFKEVAKLGENDEKQESIDAATLGKIIHDVLQEIYEALASQNISIHYLEDKLKNLDILLHQSFLKFYEGGNIKTGKNLLTTKVAKRFIQNYIKFEIKQLKDGNSIIIKSLEDVFEIDLKIDPNNFPKGIETIRFKGIIDRIDQFNNDLRIIDYKTGSVKSSDLAFKDWGLIFTEAKTDKSFQLAFYAWLYHKKTTTNELIYPGIYSLKKLSEGFIKLKTPDGNNLNKENYENFEKLLIKLVAEIFDKNIPFKQTQDEKLCSYCNYNTICNK